MVVDLMHALRIEVVDEVAPGYQAKASHWQGG